LKLKRFDVKIPTLSLKHNVVTLLETRFCCRDVNSAGDLTVNYPRNLRFILAAIFLASLVIGQPARAARPPIGEARPPIHVKGNATAGPTGLSPAQVRHFYGFDRISNGGAGQTIAIVDAYDDPNIESDLAVFSEQLGLPSCTSSNGCFTKISASGKKPRTDAGWALEISLDVEWAHAIAPAANILLVEAATSRFTDLIQAVDVAVANGASAVSMSFGGSEFSSQTMYDNHFNVEGVTFTASSGDSGSGVEYPAASPYVVGVGGTTLQTDSSGTYLAETAWSGSGGGESTAEMEPSYQSNFGIESSGSRGVPDVAYGADPSTGFSVYDSTRYQGQAGWFKVGGTSAGAPQWAAVFAIVNSLRASTGDGAISGAHYALYDSSGYSTNFNDITDGSNGNCGNVCNAGSGYDFVTGLGSPKIPDLVNAFVGN
jgi:subtilase family serine protease